MKIATLGKSALFGATLALAVTQANAGNITIGDPNTGSKVGSTVYTEGLTGWYKGGTGPTSEYGEVEPGMSTGTAWDLAAFIQGPTGTGTLGVLSGFNLKDGYQGRQIGDIFVETRPITTNNGFFKDLLVATQNTDFPKLITNGTPITDNNPMTTDYGFNYDFAVRFDFPNLKYKVYSLDSNTVFENGEYWNGTDYNAASNPWRVATATDAATFANGNTGYLVGTYDLTYTNTHSAAAGTALAGFAVSADYKYYVDLKQVDSWLNPALDLANDGVGFHLTMYCGNDNLTGFTAAGFKTPDGGLTLILLGGAFAGLWAASRRRS